MDVPEPVSALSSTASQHQIPPPSPPLPPHQQQQQQQQQKEGSSDESRILSTTAALAKEAASLFHSRSYRECLDLLSQMQQKKDDDPKVLHNFAVAEYLHDGCKDPHKLLDILSKVKRKNEELARSAGEQFDGSTSGSRGSNTSSGGSGLTEPVGSSSDSTAFMEDYDTSISTLNTAVIMYHLQQYAAASSVLEPLYRNIEPVDEHTALRVCILMLDISLASRQLKKADDIHLYMEKAFCSVLTPPGETGSSMTLSQPQLSSTTDGNPIPNVNTYTVASPSIPSPIAEPSLTRTSSEEVLDEEALSLGLDIESSHAVRSVVSANISRCPVERPSATLKLLVHLYKVRLLLQTRNLKATKREVKGAINLARGGDYVTALLLKAQLEYLRENHRKAIKLLTTSSKEPGMTSLFLNNLGCINHQLRKPHTAARYFLKALQNCASTGTERPAFCQDKSLAILYNAGMQQLRCGIPILAFRCFQEASRLYYNQPLLWLRLAECCLMALEKGLLENSQYEPSGTNDDLKVCVVGEGKWRRILLPAGGVNPIPTGLGLKLEDAESGELKLSTSSEADTEFFVPGKPHQLSLVLARKFLHNALLLLDRRVTEAATEAEAAEMKGDNNSQSLKTGDSKGGGNGQALQAGSNGNGKDNKGISGMNITTASVIAYEEEKRKEDIVVRQFVLVDMIFVELCLENPLKAFKIAENLLQQPACTRTSRFLGRMYAAEALCMLNRPTEAADHLSAYLSESTHIEGAVSGIDDDVQKWKSGDHSEASGDGEDGASNNVVMGGTPAEVLSISSLTGPQARASLYVNLAAVNAMQGDLTQAHHWAMQAVSITPANPSAVLSVVYVELLQGNTHEAVTTLKQYRHLSCRIDNMKTRPT